ncbi:MAG: matrixin family metalloprotease [Bacteriovoracaceae bacterium]
MKKILLFGLIIFSTSSFAFTLNNNFGAAFKSKTVNVQVAGNSNCSSVPPEELASMIKPAIDDFWNRVSTSSLRLKDGGFSDPINNISNGILCPPTDSACISQGTTIPPVKGIIIGCNNNGANFSSSSAVLAVTVPNHFSGNAIVGAVILINDMPSNIFSQLSRNEQISVIAHEIGHAIGLGHSKDHAALMYYRTVDHRERLGQDDIDGVSYLYPVKMDACGLMGTIEETKTPPFFTTVGALLLMILMSECLRLFKRAKRRATL